MNRPAYLRAIASALGPIDETRFLTLVLAGEDEAVCEFAKIYDATQGKGFTVAEKVSQSVEAETVRICGEPCMEQHEKAVADTLQKLKDTDTGNDRYSEDVKEIVKAAENGRLSICALSRDAEMWLKRVGFDDFETSSPDEGPAAFEASDFIFFRGTPKGSDLGRGGRFEDAG